jgi:hypothetical protein
MKNIFKNMQRTLRANKEIKNLEEQYSIELDLARSMICATQLFAGGGTNRNGQKTLDIFKYYTEKLRSEIMQGASEFDIMTTKEFLEADMCKMIYVMMNVK